MTWVRRWLSHQVVEHPLRLYIWVNGAYIAFALIACFIWEDR